MSRKHIRAGIYRDSDSKEEYVVVCMPADHFTYASRFLTYVSWRSWLHVLGVPFPLSVYDWVAWQLRYGVYWARDLGTKLPSENPERNNPFDALNKTSGREVIRWMRWLVQREADVRRGGYD